MCFAPLVVGNLPPRTRQTAEFTFRSVRGLSRARRFPIDRLARQREVSAIVSSLVAQLAGLVNVRSVLNLYASSSFRSRRARLGFRRNAGLRVMWIQMWRGGEVRSYFRAKLCFNTLLVSILSQRIFRLSQFQEFIRLSRCNEALSDGIPRYHGI